MSGRVKPVLSYLYPAQLVILQHLALAAELDYSTVFSGMCIRVFGRV